MIPKGLFLFCCCYDFHSPFSCIWKALPFVSICPIASHKNFSSGTTKFCNSIHGHFNIYEVSLLLNCFYNCSLLLNKGQEWSHLDGWMAYTLLASISYPALQTLRILALPSELHWKSFLFRNEDLQHSWEHTVLYSYSLYVLLPPKPYSKCQRLYPLPLNNLVLPSKTAPRHKIYINNKYFVENHIVIDDKVPIQKKKSLEYSTMRFPNLHMCS